MAKTKEEIAADFWATLDLHDAGLDVMRSRLRRDDPNAADDEIDRRLQRWLLNRPPDCPGQRVDLARFGLENDAMPAISRDLAVMGGEPCIAGLRVTVGMIVGLVNAGRSTEQILAAYPYLTADDIEAAIIYDRQHQGSARKSAPGE